MNATETLQKERAMMERSPVSIAMEKIIELSMNNITVNRLLQGWRLGQCSFEDALVGMVLALDLQNKHLMDELMNRPVVYQTITIPDGADKKQP